VIRFKTRLPVRRRIPAAVSALAASALLAGPALAGCGAGQIAQTSLQEPAVNGAAGQIGQLALRNVYLRAEQTSDFLRPGQQVELVFVATNQSPDVEDKLSRVTSDVGTVTLTGDARLPAGGALIVGNRAEQDLKALDAAEAADAAKATVALTKPISNGLTYPFTFDFEHAGSVRIDVPVAAGENAP
jgi:copper(I)-binding protein